MIYDWLNRLQHKGYPDSTGVDYIYDLVGKIKQVTDPTGTYGFAYDNMGRLIGTTTQYTFIPGQTFTNSYTYDAASNRTGFTAPDSSTTTYGYDALNRLTDQTNSWAGHFVFAYDDLSRRTSLTRPNGINTSYTYDNLSRLLSVLHQQGANTVDGAVYTYDNAGNRNSKQNLLNGVTENYIYDAIYQLKQVTQGANTTESYTYDAVGNRLSSLDVSTYSYDSSNHLNSSSDGVSYTYDNNGNTLTKTDSSGTTQYAWDFENRLTSVTLPGAGGVVSFGYDPFGRRIQKNSASGTANYLYDGDNIVAGLNSSGGIIGEYAQGEGIDQILGMFRGGVSDFYDADGAGSITSVYDSGGTQAASYSFTSFGNTNSTGNLFNPFSYTGREREDETGLYYYRARYYDPRMGRFLTEDPIRFRGGLNFYPYARNNPVALVDPFGYQACIGTGQSPCKVPTDPNAPYQGPDGLWYNVPEWHPRPPMTADSTVPSAVPSLNPSPQHKPPSAGPLFCKCLENARKRRRQALISAYSETAIGGLVILGEIAIAPYVIDQLSAGEAGEVGLETLMDNAHVATGFAGPVAIGPILYVNGIMNATTALDIYDQEEADCNLAAGYPE